jgi:hypothetical protein
MQRAGTETSMSTFPYWLSGLFHPERFLLTVSQVRLCCRRALCSLGASDDGVRCSRSAFRCTLEPPACQWTCWSCSRVCCRSRWRRR